MTKTIHAEDIATAEDFLQAAGEILTGKATVSDGVKPSLAKTPVGALTDEELGQCLANVTPFSKRERSLKLEQERRLAKIRKLAEPAPVLGTVRVGKGTFPARTLADGTVERNRKADGTGTWMVASATAAPTFTPDAPAVTAKTPRTVRPLVADGAKVYRVRANGTRRRVPLLEGKDLEEAKAIKDARDAGETMRQISDRTHQSVSTLRRALQSLELTLNADARPVAQTSGS